MSFFNKYQTIVLFLLAVCVVSTTLGQKKRYLPVVIGFYNLENLYDTVRNNEIDDVDFSISGRKHYSPDLYREKLDHIARVLSELGAETQKEGFAILGVAELENDTILFDIIHHPLLISRKLQFVHFDSKDRRGVDVAMIYNPKFFKVKRANPIFVAIPTSSKTNAFTRDILHVEGELIGENVHLYINHWPSRVGGEKKSYPARAAAAKILRNHIANVWKNDSVAKIVVMGDLNDDPNNRSILKDLGATSNTLIPDTLLYNPWMEKIQKGYGTLAYRNAWSLFDQIMLDKSWLAINDSTLFFHKATIFKPDYLIETNGNYKGYPKRTFAGDNFQGGYSDHFPVFVTLLKYIGL